MWLLLFSFGRVIRRGTGLRARPEPFKVILKLVNIVVFSTIPAQFRTYGIKLDTMLGKKTLILLEAIY